MNTILVENVSKFFGENQALKNISLSIESNEFFGLIGPDGAGKTTLMRILCTLLLPDEGKASMGGLDVVDDYKQIRKLIGYMPGNFSLYQDLSVEENLRFYATVFGTTIEKNFDLIKDIYYQLEPFKNRRAGKLSGGMKQKLALCCALIHQPRFLILDEPTTGVDAVSRQEFWIMLHRLKEKNISVLVSTPYMDEAKQCDRVALLQTGKILKIGTPEQITLDYESPLFAIKTNKLFDCKKEISKMKEIDHVHSFGQELHAKIGLKGFNEQQVKDRLKLQGYEVEVRRIQPGIEDCFIDLMLKEDA